MDKSRAVYGIDLGTTYSCVSMIDDFDQPVVLRNLEGDTTTPSVVYFESKDTFIVGQEAKGMEAVEPERTVSLIKRRIGDDSAFDKATNGLPYGYDPSEISAMILRKLVNDANAGTGLDVCDVVITCPAYFGTKERMQTRQAGEIAGLNVLGIINEPTAAAISYGVRTEGKKTVLVYDLGGGTFDVTIINVNGGAIKVIATGGDHHLGGSDWDRKLAEFFLDALNAENSASLSPDEPGLMPALMLEAELKKKQLTAKTSVTANISFRGLTARATVTRDIFEALTDGLLEETADCVKNVIAIAADKGYSHIDEVLLVGGSSRMPQVKERISREFGLNVRLADPDECVAKGAAIYALNHAYTKSVRDYEEGRTEKMPAAIRGDRTKVVNVTSKSYGIGIINNMVAHVVYANTPLPIHMVDDTFYTVEDGQTGVTIPVYESDFTSREDHHVRRDFCSLLDSCVLEFDRPYPAKTTINYIFDIDEEGLFNIRASVDNNRVEFSIKLTGVRTSGEITKSRDIITKARIE